ncbi:small RNA-binding protein 11, chloroplastic isoform X1 [Mangifera indica]|uniref:small RNA-binding protein 11, chloroplastic isoform X1 n=1 Tax=Mangifera indica TaxID=29780 RepID=UPI001CFB112B|nr:small RNA-binding protein 11, chloroplastic isoform X1 [Mangifera indica]
MAKRLSPQLFVSRLSFYTTNQELKRLFSRFGVVTEARMILDPKTQRPKGFGFVSFESEVEAQKALKAMNGRVILKLLHDVLSYFCFIKKESMPHQSSETSLVFRL